ncbi:class Ib ribonucleoside-diphosphate reductase assembly flavoprotein NrdI [Listeria innocua]|uniref:class Ib ribonucleoside-diphosphate reductase assembly flavoprotein NrdI n=1 Tax=Enterococcus italicus TaxID=246144 RepID=UPI002072B70E|nr:class Ib ribonucleoside-diphosphate reductase assembly flavoprotein NrdI [Enterococcus italicus]EKQ5086598.1 class Ib ribonucleoside-diphosphate reductase assembly flavoprotein NrdI [Listeria innocua]
MQTIQVYYISLSGNTTSFLKNLDRYFQQEYQKKLKYVNVKNLVKDGKSLAFDIKKHYFAFLPSYLEGGNGIDTGDTEILTTPLRQLIAYSKNREYCLGIVGSGNRNFNKQFCLTAHQYAREFGFSVLDEFELKGTETDIKRIAEKMDRQLTEIPV